MLNPKRKLLKALCFSLCLTLLFTNFSFLVQAREVTNEGILYHDQESWCEGDAVNVCKNGVINPTACTKCQEGVCAISPTPTASPAISGCGHLDKNCCPTTPKCYEGNPIRQGFLGLFGCKCLLEGDNVGILYVNTGCRYAGEEICRNGNIYKCELANEGFAAKNMPCYYRWCMNNIHCQEFPAPSPTPSLIPTSTNTPTPTPIVIQCDREGNIRCNPEKTALQRCVKDCGTDLLVWRTVSICPAGCDESTQTCSRDCPGNPCSHPGTAFCATGSQLGNCDSSGCVTDYQDCLYGCNKDAQPNRCTSLEEVVSVKAGETFHFNDPVLRWSPTLGPLTRLFYEKGFGGIYSSDSGKAITLSNAIADLNKFLSQDPAYRCITSPESLKFATFLLGALVFFSPYYTPIVIRNMQASSQFPLNVNVSPQITYNQFVESADPELVKEIKLVAQENPDIYIVLRTPEEFERIRIANGYQNLWAMKWNSGPNGINTGSGFIPPRTDYIEIGYHAPVGIPSHELGHIITDRTGVSERIYDVLGRLGVGVYGVPIQPYREVVATVQAQRFLVEHGFPIPPPSTQYLQLWQDKLFEALKLVLNF